MKDKIKIFGLAWLLSVAFLIILFLAGCSTNTIEQPMESDEMLIVIEDHSLSLGYYIVYDKDTKIIYYQGINNGAFFSPLYNPDGTFKLYNEDN